MSKNKRCSKGKSCGATCIHRQKVCRKELGEISKSLQSVSGAVAGKQPPPVPQGSPSGGGLSKLESAEDFIKKLASTDGYYSSEISEMHHQISRVLGADITEGASTKYKDQNQRIEFAKRREELFRSLGEGDVNKGRQAAMEAYKGIKDFTKSAYDEIRQAQFGIMPAGPERDSYLKQAKSIENLFASKEINKPKVEKFRGIMVDNDVLAGMIASARERGSYGGEALSSWSTSLPKAKEFADNAQFDTFKNNRVIFRAVNSKGVPIHPISSLLEEYEVLTPSSANYRYLGHRQIKVETEDDAGKIIATYHVFDVEEF
jgi:hypothetical protein